MFLSCFLQELPVELQITSKLLSKVLEIQYDLVPLQPFRAHPNSLAPSWPTHLLLAALGTAWIVHTAVSLGRPLVPPYSHLLWVTSFDLLPKIHHPLTSFQFSRLLPSLEIITAFVPLIDVCQSFYTPKGRTTFYLTCSLFPQRLYLGFAHHRCWINLCEWLKNESELEKSDIKYPRRTTKMGASSGLQAESRHTQRALYILERTWR